MSSLGSLLFNLICFKFKMISMTSSITPRMVENSCSTPAILTCVIANPSNEDNNILLNELPIVCPKPGSNGLNSKEPSNSVAFVE